MRNNGNRWAHRTFEDAAKAQAKREADVLAAQLRRNVDEWAAEQIDRTKYAVRPGDGDIPV